MIKFFRDKTFLKYLLLGLVLRLILMPFTFHWDIKAIAFGAHLPYWGYGTDIYDFLYKFEPYQGVAQTYGQAVLTYPPLLLYLLGFFYFILSPILGSLFSPWLFASHESTLATEYIFRYLFVLKLPYLFFDLALGLLITSFFSNIEEKFKAWKLWMFNPITLYATFMVGQSDVITTFFLILATLYLLKNNTFLSGLFLGIGVSLKLFPFILVPFFVFAFRRFGEKVRFFIGCLTVPILTFLPFITSGHFRQNVLLSDQSQRMLAVSFKLFNGDNIFLFLVVFFILFILFIEQEDRLSTVPKFVFLELLAFFALSHFHPQWFIWITPFLVWFLVKKEFTSYVYWLVSLFFLITLLFEASLTWGLFAPLGPSVIEWFPGLSQIIDKVYSAEVINSVFRSFFVAVSLIFGWRVVNEKKNIFN